MMIVFGEMDYEKEWTQQFHYEAIRNNNSKMFSLLGPDTGLDSIGEFTTGEIPASEMERVNQMIEDICYNNAKSFFQF